MAFLARSFYMAGVSFRGASSPRKSHLLFTRKTRLRAGKSPSSFLFCSLKCLRRKSRGATRWRVCYPGAPCGQTRRSKILQISVQLRILSGRGFFSWRFQARVAVRRSDGRKRRQGEGGVSALLPLPILPTGDLCSTALSPLLLPSPLQSESSSCCVLPCATTTGSNPRDKAPRRTPTLSRFTCPWFTSSPREETTSANKWQGGSQIREEGTSRLIASPREI